MDWTSFAAILDAPRDRPEPTPTTESRYGRKDPPVVPRRPRYGNLPPLGESPNGSSAEEAALREAQGVYLFGLAAAGLGRP